jgi:hypothetical protein
MTFSQRSVLELNMDSSDDRGGGPDDDGNGGAALRPSYGSLGGPGSGPASPSDPAAAAEIEDMFKSPSKDAKAYEQQQRDGPLTTLHLRRIPYGIEIPDGVDMLEDRKGVLVEPDGVPRGVENTGGKSFQDPSRPDAWRQAQHEATRQRAAALRPRPGTAQPRREAPPDPALVVDAVPLRPATAGADGGSRSHGRLSPTLSVDLHGHSHSHSHVLDQHSAAGVGRQGSAFTAATGDSVLFGDQAQHQAAVKARFLHLLRRLDGACQRVAALVAQYNRMQVSQSAL